LERTLKYEKKFIYIYTIITSMIIIYFLVSKILYKCDRYIIYGLTMVIVIYIINIIFHWLDYLKNIRVFYFTKLVQLIITSFVVLERNRFLSNSACIMYIMLCVEVITILGFKSKLIRYHTYVLVILPLAITSIYRGITGYLNFVPLLFMLQIIIVIIGVYIIFYGSTEDLKNQVNIQKKLWLRAKNKNEELVVSGQQIQLVHDQLVKQKMELEEANERLNRFTAEMYIQNELLSYISSVLDIDELMELVTDSILGAIGVDTCSLVIYDVNLNAYHYKVKSTHGKDYLKSFIDNMKSGKLDKYFSIRDPYIDNEIIKGKYDFTSERDVGSIVIIPILNDKNTYGLLIAEHTSTQMINENSIQFFQGIANQINIAINNANLYTKMEEMAKRDGLTCVYNRNYLQKIFHELYEDARINQKVLSLALFDIDKFKKVNDTYGHIFGDQVLKIIADISEKYANRNGSIVGRYGGEEFVIIFPNKTLDEAYKIMEEIHNSIINQKISHDDKLININISTGISSYPKVCKNPKDLLKRADNAMYISKANGRGRITIDNINL